MRVVRKLMKDSQGSAVIELAFALPILIEMMWFMVQGGMVFRAMAGIQHALGEGARYATLYPQPNNSQITSKMYDAVFGIGPGTYSVTAPVPGTADGAKYLDLQVTYTQQTDLLLFPGPTITVRRSKRVWVTN